MMKILNKPRKIDWGFWLMMGVFVFCMLYLILGE